MQKILSLLISIVSFFNLFFYSCYASPQHRFSPEEDQELIKLANRYGTEHWTIIADHMKNRTPRQCRDRYIYYLAENINNSNFTPEEDRLLIQLVNDNGHKWAIISKFFDNRTDLRVKNRYYCLINNRQRKPKPFISKQKETIPDNPEYLPSIEPFMLNLDKEEEDWNMIFW